MSPPAPAPGRERILFVDDEEVLTRMGKIMLERMGYTVTVYNDSLDALAAFIEEPDRFDLVVTDQTMPGMTGTDLARRLLQLRPGLPIILCTGFSNLVDEESAQLLGIKGFVLKPLSRNVIASSSAQSSTTRNNANVTGCSAIVDTVHKFDCIDRRQMVTLCRTKAGPRGAEFNVCFKKE